MTAETDLLPLPEPVAYADPMAFDNFKRQGHLGGVYGREWMWAKPDAGLVAMYSAEQVAHATAAKDAEVEALRAEVEALKEIAAYNHDTAMRVGALLEAAEARAERLEEALRRYRNEVPLGHQPHMLAHEVDDLLNPTAAQEAGRG